MRFSNPKLSEPTQRPQQTAIIKSDAQHRLTRNRLSFLISKTWDGKLDSFPAYKRMVEGHLLQVGAGYLFDKTCVDRYKELGESYFYSDEFFYRYRTSQAQVMYDRSYLYGLLLTTNCKNPMCPLLKDPTYKDTSDRILCWSAFCERYAHQGLPLSVEVDRLEQKLFLPCESTVSYTGFRSFLDQHETSVYVLQHLLCDTDKPLLDTYIKERLVQSLQLVAPVLHLTQKISNTKDMDYRASLRYLGQNAILCTWPNST